MTVTRRRDEGRADAAALRRCGPGCSAGWGRSTASRPVTATAWTKLVCTRPVAGIDHLRQLVGVGALELGEAAVFEHLLRQRVVLRPACSSTSSSVEGAPDGVFFTTGRPCWSNRISASCLGELRLKGWPASCVGLGFELHHLAAEFVALLRQRGRVDQHAVALHAEQHFGHRQFDVAVEASSSRLRGELRAQRLMHAQGDVGILGGIFGGALDVDLGEGDARGALAGDVVVADGRQAADGARRASRGRAACRIPARRIRAACRRRCRASAMP